LGGRSLVVSGGRGEITFIDNFTNPIIVTIFAAAAPGLADNEYPFVMSRHMALGYCDMVPSQYYGRCWIS